MLDELRPRLTDALIGRSVGSETFRRGAVYADQGRVSDVAYSERHGTLSATVRGSGGRVYTTVVEFDPHEIRWWGECSCPVGMDCKHVAAVLLATQWALTGTAVPAGPTEPARPGWERALGELVGADSSVANRKGSPLGLQFEVEGAAPGRSVQPDSPVRLRPAESLSAADGFLPRNFSVEARALLSAALNNGLDLEAVVFLDEDDTSRRLFDVWQAYAEIPALGLVPLPRLDSEPACQRYARALVELADSLATYSGHRFTDYELLYAIDIYNEQRCLWRSLRQRWIEGALSASESELNCPVRVFICGFDLRYGVVRNHDTGNRLACAVGQKNLCLILLLSQYCLHMFFLFPSIKGKKKIA